DLGTGSGLNINDAITVETWINTSENKAVQFIAGRGDTGYSGWFLSWEGGTIQFKVGSGSAAVRPVSPGNQINTWYHVVGTYDRTSAKLYINGENKDTVPFTSPINYGSIARTWIGQIPGGGGTPARYFNGKIDEVRIYNRSLSPEEINASYNAGVYRLYRNFTNLPEGVYNYRAFVQNATGIVSQTETRFLTLTTGPVPLSITGFAPSSSLSDLVGAIRTFNLSTNQTMNITWYLNGTFIQLNESVNNATYTNSSAATGIWNVSAVAENGNGSVMQTWEWSVANTTEGISISFTDPTPANGTTQASSYAYINTTISDSSSTTAFIDWNRSLAGWWRFNNEIGETSSYFKDWSTWVNDGACSGTACPVSTPGRFGTALNFDGSNDY
ncbi:MAG: LamG domain-containing protein, partial [Desulfobacterales bacterium]|nr:LamG domain-containing protein [Desulfobacterales bacterium]